MNMNIRKEFFRYVIPSMLAFALSGIYAIADGFFVGNALGDSALAAINMAYPMTAFLQATGAGLGMGGAIGYAISMGSGDRERARKYFAMSLIMLTVSAALLTVLFLAGSGFVLKLFGATGEIYDLGREYLLYISLGAVFQILGTGLVPFIRNMDGAMEAMAAMAAGFITNIVLDYLFVWVFPWGMMGAAVATITGQAVTFLVCVMFFILKRVRPDFQFREEAGSLLRHVFQVAISPFGLTFSPNITLILVNKNAAVYGGEAAVTCYAAISYISCIILLLLQGVSDGSQPLVSLAFGEGQKDDARKLRNLAYQFAFLVSVVSVVVLYLARGRCASLFGASPEVAADVAQVMPIFLAGFLFVSVSRVTTAFFYAVGDNLRAYLLIYGEPVFLFLLLLFLPGMLGVEGTWMSVPISQILVAFMSVGLAAAGRKKTK